MTFCNPPFYSLQHLGDFCIGHEEIADLSSTLISEYQSSDRRSKKKEKKEAIFLSDVTFALPLWKMVKKEVHQNENEF